MQSLLESFYEGAMINIYSRKLVKSYLTFLEKPTSENECRVAAFLASFMEALNKGEPRKLIKFFPPEARIDSLTAKRSVNPQAYMQIVKRASDAEAVEAAFLDNVQFYSGSFTNSETMELFGVLSIINRGGGAQSRECRIGLQYDSSNILQISEIKYPHGNRTKHK